MKMSQQCVVAAKKVNKVFGCIHKNGVTITESDYTAPCYTGQATPKPLYLVVITVIQGC